MCFEIHVHLGHLFTFKLLTLIEDPVQKNEPSTKLNHIIIVIIVYNQFLPEKQCKK